MIKLTQSPITTVATVPVTVAELPEFSRRSAKLLSEVERQDITATLRHWERGDRSPRGASLVLLNVIDHNPGAVIAALTAKR